MVLPVVALAGQSFPKTHRLRQRREFLFFKNSGTKTHTKHFIVLFSRKNKGPSRLGVTVSKKIGGAVQRNRVKRLVREFFRQNYHCLLVATDFSVIAKKGAAAVDFATVCRELDVMKRDLSSPGTSCSRKSSLL